MKDPFSTVDRLSRDALAGWEVPPPTRVAAGIRKRMFWFNLWHRPVWKYTALALGLAGLSTAGLIWATSTFNQDLPAKRFAGPNIREARQISAQFSGTETAVQGNPAMVSSNVSSPSGKPVNQTNSAMVPSGDVLPSGKPVNQNDPEIIAEQQVAAGLKNSYVQPQEPQSQTNNSGQLAGVGMIMTQNITLRQGDLQRIPLLYPAGESALNKILNPVPNKKYPRKPLFALSLNVTPLIANTGEKQTEEIRVSTTEPTGTVALLLQYNLKHWFLETGIQYTLLQTRQKADQLLYNPRELQQQVLAGQELLVDTTSYWHYYYIQDSVIHLGDSVWTTEYDSSYSNIYDNVSSTLNDTLKNASWVTGISLFEIPVGAGYRFYAGHMEFNVKGGVILGLQSKLSGHTFLASSSAGLVPLTECYSTKSLQYSWYLSATAIRPLSEKWALMLSPSWRSSIKGFKGNEGIATRSYNAWGLGVGLRVEF